MVFFPFLLLFSSFFGPPSISPFFCQKWRWIRGNAWSRAKQWNYRVWTTSPPKKWFKRGGLFPPTDKWISGVNWHNILQLLVIFVGNISAFLFPKSPLVSLKKRNVLTFWKSAARGNERSFFSKKGHLPIFLPFLYSKGKKTELFKSEGWGGGAPLK